MLNFPFGIDNVEELYRNNESGPAGYYPIGTGNFWHGGIHINCSEKKSIKPIIPGLVITYRINTKYQQVALPKKLTETEYNNLGDQDQAKYTVEEGRLKHYKIKEGLTGEEKTKNVSDNFILMRHEYSPSQLQSGTLVFYSLYMNLAPACETGNDYYGDEFKKDQGIQVLQKKDWFSTDRIGMPGLYGRMRYVEYAVITEKELFNYKEKIWLAEKDRKFIFYKVPSSVSLFKGSRKTVSSKQYYIPLGTTYTIGKKDSRDGKTVKEIKLTSMPIYLLTSGMKYAENKKSFTTGDKCEINNLDTIWMGRQAIPSSNGKIPENCTYITDKISGIIKGMLKTERRVTGVMGTQPGITLDFEKDCPCEILFWSGDSMFSGSSVGISQEFTVYEENPFSYVFEETEISEEERAEIKGFLNGIYKDDKGKEYRKTDKGFYIEEGKVQSCMKSAFDWDCFFDKKTEPFGETEDIFCDRSELLRQIDTSGFIDNFLNGQRISRTELMRLYGPGENFTGTESIRENMRKVVCKHPIEWDGEQFRNIKNLYDKKSPFGHMSDELAAGLLEMAKATDLWTGGLKSTFRTNNLNFVHPAYFLNHLDKAGIIGGAIVKFVDKFNMSELSVLLGKDKTTKISDEGCYITTYANMFFTSEQLENYYLPNASKYNRVLLINADKDLFSSNSGELNGDAALETLFGVKGKDWVIWEKSNSNPSFLLDKLKEIDSAGQNCMIAGVFDLSTVTSKEHLVNNHMVGIGGLPNSDNVFDGTIIKTSNGDLNRLQNDNKKTAYCIKYLKKIIVVYLQKK